MIPFSAGMATRGGSQTRLHCSFKSIQSLESNDQSTHVYPRFIVTESSKCPIGIIKAYAEMPLVYRSRIVFESRAGHGMSVDIS